MLKHVISLRVEKDVVKPIVTRSILFENRGRNSRNAAVYTIKFVDQSFVSDLLKERSHKIAGPVENDQRLNVTESLIKLNFLLL